MAGLIDKVSSLPKWAILAGGGVLLAGVAYGMYYVSFGSKKPKEEVTESVVIDMPDAPVDQYSTTALNAFKEEEMKGGSTVEDYWVKLGKGGDPLEVSMPGGSGNLVLDPAEYSELERYYIENGIRSKEEIDRQHAEDAARAEQARREEERLAAEQERSRPKVLTQAQQDSIYFARLEKAYAMAAKYNTAASAEPEPEAAEPAAEPLRKIDVGAEAEPSTLPMDAFSSDGIVTSLDEPSSNGIVTSGGRRRAEPKKATFLKNERLVSGNRVILRLMEDLVLSDGTVIPQNTHITGICSIGNRLRINISVLHYGGRMFPVDISVYDNDGTEGIYCAAAEKGRNASKKVKEVAGDMVSGVGSVVGLMVTGNPLVGSLASRGLSSGVRTLSSAINEDGSVAIDVMAGYELYVYENVKDEDGRGNG